MALHVLAALDEKRSQPRAAAVYLRRLVETDLASASAHLRLGVVLARVGRHEEARERLRSVSSLEEPAWVATVAFQELARLEMAWGERASALAAVRRGLERFPEDAQLLLLYAYLQQDAFETSLAVLDRLTPRLRGRSAGEGPRALYNYWPRSEAEAAARRLESDLRARDELLLANLSLASRRLGVGS